MDPACPLLFTPFIQDIVLFANQGNREEKHYILQFITSCAVPESTISETLRSKEGGGRENVAETVNSCSFNLHRAYSKSLTFSNVGEPS